ncbi:MAG: hypothetical protein ACXVGG_14245 [Mycobacteriaceae bacterium]
MKRADVARNGPLEPACWPDWVLAFGGGYFPEDKVKQSAQMLEFRTWQRARADWFAEHGLVASVRVCNEEHRRRAGVWRAVRPEDAGR